MADALQPFDCAALQTRMAARHVTRLYDDALRPVGLRVTQFTLLAAVSQKKPASIGELADMLAIERSTLSRNLKLLEQDELIVSTEGPARARGLAITERGLRKLSEALPLWRTVQDRLLSEIGEQSWDEARNVLGRLARLFEKQ